MIRHESADIGRAGSHPSADGGLGGRACVRPHLYIEDCRPKSLHSRSALHRIVTAQLCNPAGGGKFDTRRQESFRSFSEKFMPADINWLYHRRS